MRTYSLVWHDYNTFCPNLLCIKIILNYDICVATKDSCSHTYYSSGTIVEWEHILTIYWNRNIFSEYTLSPPPPLRLIHHRISDKTRCFDGFLFSFVFFGIRILASHEVIVGVLKAYFVWLHLHQKCIYTICIYILVYTWCIYMYTFVFIYKKNLYI